MSIWERVQAALGGLDPAVPFGANVFVTETGTPLPDLFLVYFLVSSPSEQQADDGETGRSWRVQVSHYCRQGLADLPDVVGVMVGAGFARGPERELPYDRVTRHFGLAQEFVYVE